MDRRELLKASLLTCGVTVASRAFGSSLAPNQLADSAAPEEAIVRTSLGRLRGAYVNGVYSFKGVHYGASTAGAMRFLPPSTPMPWTGVRDALELGPLPPQSTEWPAKYAEIHRFLGNTLGPGQMSEDCLVLNLWTPSLQRSNKRPVMVWLHGGACSSGIPLFDGTHLAARHDVVVVGLNHRLSFFGHLYLGGIGGEKYADSGNLGLLDIVPALQWVRSNIAHFGGDPHNVTIFGESNGGGEVSVLMAMPSAKDLFQKAIVESGSDLRVRSREEADATARKFLAELHVAQDRVDDLQAIPMDRFIAAVHSMGESFFDAVDLRPVLDGRSLPRQPFDPDAPAISADVPMLIGTNADEMRTFFGLTDPALFSLNEADMRTKLKAYGGFADDSKLDELIALYKKNRPNATPSDIFFAIVTKAWFRMDAITQAERKAAQRAAPVYMYIFEWQSPVRGGKLKAFHGAELPFVFDNVDKAPGLIGEGAGLQPLADRVSSAWVEFARAGNPDHTGLPHWPPYQVETRATMIFNDECRVVNDPDKDERLAMARLRRSRSDLSSYVLPCQPWAKLMNLPKSCTLVVALSAFVTCAVADNPPAPKPLPDPSLAVYAKPQRLIELRDKRRIHFFCLGSGTPTVILTAGLSDWAAIWSNVQASIALKTRVCAWDRAGWGHSDPSSAPQDVNHTTADLEEALQRSRIDGPYVLVGHSMGGYESLLFADRHPRQVLAMVLVDPAFPDQSRRLRLVAPKVGARQDKFWAQHAATAKKCAAELKSGRLTTESPDPDKCFDYEPIYPPELKAALTQLDTDPARLMTQASTWELFPRSSLIALNPERNYRSMPIRVLMADHPYGADPPVEIAAELPSFEVEWRRAHDALAALSTDGINTTVEGTSHYIHTRKPAVVISTVDEVIDKVRARPVASQQH